MSATSTGAIRSRGVDLSGSAPWQALVAALLVAALAIGILAPLPDVSWLTLAAERMLQGQRLYTQVMEVNPPLSVLLYVPPVLLAGALGVTPETASAWLCVLAIAFSLALSGALLRPVFDGDGTRAWKLAAAAAFVLCVMPVAAFGQREHIAVMALMPYLAVCFLRSEARKPPWMLALVAGLGMGFAVCIKPHFAAVGILPALWAMWRTRQLRPYAEVEIWAAAAAMAAYAVVVLTWFANFLTDFLPVALETYVPIRTPFWMLLVLPGVPLAVVAVIAARLLRLNTRWLAVPLLAGLGGAVAYLAQGKGWPYHAYPMLAFTMLGLLGGAALTPRDRMGDLSRLAAPLALLAPLAAMVWLSTGILPGPLRRPSPPWRRRSRG